MKPLNAFVLGLFGVFLIFGGADARCKLFIESPQPKTLIHFGSKHWISESTSEIIRDDYESVELFCANGFKYYRNGYGHQTMEEKRIKLTCQANINQFTTDRITNGVHKIECLGNRISPIYESKTPMEGCNKYMSLVVGQSYGEYGSIKNVAICYDIVKQQLKYVSYTAYPSKNKVLEQSQVGQLNELGLDIEVEYSKNVFKPISSDRIMSAFHTDKHLNVLFGTGTFEYASLIQDDALSQDVNEFEGLISIVWLRALRNGNWRHFLNALRDASVHDKFDVNVGVSGTVAMPILNACEDNRTLSIEVDSENTITVPAHIWAHVRTVEPALNASEFVVIAHNSPFFTINERNGLCQSMCHEVPWLKNSLFSKLQKYPVYGLVQCCKATDVQYKLDNFPIRMIQELDDPIIRTSDESIIGRAATENE